METSITRQIRRERRFIQVSALSSDQSIEDVCHTEATHHLQPYGTDPLIIPTEVDDQEACFVIPSDDQPKEMNRQAALIAKYPIPIQINGVQYHYFILWQINMILIR